MNPTIEDLRASKGLLLVFTEPGAALPLEQYHDWYDNEHIPNRIALPKPGIPFAFRLQEIDGSKPTWGAAYDLDQVSVIQSDAFKKLLSDQSDREKEIFKDLYAERRVYAQSPDGDYSAEGYKQLAKGNIVVLSSVDIKPGSEEEVFKWHVNEQIPLFKKVPGWLRTREYKLFDSRVLGGRVLGGSTTEEYKVPPTYLALHEFSSPDNLSSTQFKDAIANISKTGIVGHIARREKKVLKVFSAFQ